MMIIKNLSKVWINFLKWPKWVHICTFFLWIGIIIYLSLVSLNNPSKISSIKHLDKFIHLIFYFVYMILFRLILNDFKPIHTIVISLIIGVSLGVTLEYLQEALTRTRFFSWYDLAFNAFGLICGLIPLPLK